MSGLCGIIRFDGNPVQKEEIQNMLDSMKNRGNDATGIWVDCNVGIGHKMLWTTPESLHEKQPLVSENNKCIVVADARIDNRDELFEQLNINENEFNVVTDIDFILGAYQKWGKECPKYLIGDFTFVVWDKIKQELFAAKDKIGMKPFYYYKDDEVFLFASEVLVLRNRLQDEAPVDEDSVQNLIDHNAIDYEHTFFKNIKRLSFASTLTYAEKNITIETYWQPQEMKISYDISYAEACSKFKELFEQAVKDRLRSAYPIGCELSGGLDSSSALCVAAQTKEGKEIFPFSLRFGNMSCDEGKFIEAVEEQTGIMTNTVDVDTMKTEKLYSHEKYYTEFSDWPTKGSFLTTFALAEHVHEKGVRILLTGQGGDHVTAGNIYGILDDLKRVKLGTVWKTVAHTYDKKRLFRLLLLRISPNKIIKVLRNIKHSKSPLRSVKVIDKNNFFDMEDFPELFSGFALGEEIGWIWGAYASYWFESNSYQQFGRKTLEVWHPFFDTRLVEFMLQLPPSYKYKEGITKSVLRDSMKGILPELVRIRGDKAEFSEPVRAELPKDFFEKKTTDFTLVKEGYLTKEKMEELINIYRSGEIKNMLYISLVLNIEIWFNYHKKTV